jgi:hypothetical protein
MFMQAVLERLQPLVALLLGPLPHAPDVEDGAQDAASPGEKGTERSQPVR